MYNYSNCPVCKKAEFKSFINCKDYTVSKQTFSIVECSSCGFKFTNPIPEINDLGNYYKSEDYISHSNTKRGLISRLYHLVRSYTLKKKLTLVSANTNSGNILDYGCGTGMFLKTCKDNNWQTYGFEPDTGAMQIAREMGLVVYNNKNELLSAGSQIKFNAITLWHVLEHVTDLDDTLSFFKERLNRDGVLIIAVPNHKSFDASYYGEYWAAYDVPRHLYHFEPKTMENLLHSKGFKLTETLPMKFDSFYVSMLSEKYKTGAINYLKAFITGLNSNMKARSAKEYSSVIYVFKHK